MKEFSSRGHWWLPNNPTEEVAGILTFDPSGQSKLELFDVFECHSLFSSEETRVPIILGVGEKGQAVTLVDCLETNTGLTVTDYSWSRSIYIPRIVLQGHHFERIDEIAFTRVSVNYYGLSEWASLDQQWGTITPDEKQPMHSTLEGFEVSLDDFKLKIRRGYSWSQPRDSFSVSREARIEIESGDSWGYNEHLSKITQFQVFLSLVMGNPTWPLTIKTPVPAKENRWISIHFHPRTDFPETEMLSKYLMISALEDHREQLERSLRNWFTKSEKLDQVLRLYNLSISERMVLEQTFLTLAKAVEVYHRQSQDKTYVDKAEYEKIKKKLRKKVKSFIGSEKYKNLRKGIYENLNWANSYSLRDRLDDIREKHEHLSSQLFKDFDTFVDDVVNTRNYLTHYVDKGKSKARLDGQSLFTMCERLRFILEICLFSELELDDEEMQELIKNMGRLHPLSSVLHTTQAES